MRERCGVHKAPQDILHNTGHIVLALPVSKAAQPRNRAGREHSATRGRLVERHVSSDVAVLRAVHGSMGVVDMLWGWKISIRMPLG